MTAATAQLLDAALSLPEEERGKSHAAVEEPRELAIAWDALGPPAQQLSLQWGTLSMISTSQVQL